MTTTRGKISPPSARPKTAPIGRINRWPGREAILRGLLLVALTICAYAPVTRADYIWDDDSYVTGNPLLRQSNGLELIWLKPLASPQYYPMTFTTLWAEFHLWAGHPGGFHVVNVLLHVADVMLLWQLLARLKVRAAWLAAAAFAVHPVHAETVAWVTELKNTQSLFFYLLAFFAYWRSGFLRFDTSADRSPRPRWGWYGLALLLFGGALLSKSVTASFPATLLLVVWWKRGRIRAADVLPLLPFFAMGIAMGSVTAWMEKHHVGAVGTDWMLTPIERCLVAARAIWFYAGKIAFPHPLIFVYPHWNIDAKLVVQWLYPVTAIAVAAGLWLARERIGRGALVAFLIFVGTLFPALGFANVYPMRFSYVADHFQYHASIGFIVLLASAVWLLLRRINLPGTSDRREQTEKPVPLWIELPLPLFLAVMTFIRVGAFRDAETLYRDTLAKNEAAWLAHDNLGAICRDSGRYSESIDHYRRGLELRPDAVHRINLGHAMATAGQVEAGIRLIADGIAADPTIPDGFIALGVIDAKRDRLTDAVADYQQAIRIAPENVLALANLGGVYQRLREFPQALECYKKALAAAPGGTIVDVHVNMAAVYAAMHQTPDVEKELAAARDADPATFDVMAQKLH